jgi:hypothetical protein
MVRVAKPKQKTEEEQFLDKVSAFLRLKASIADLTTEADNLKRELSESVAEMGDPDESGSLWVSLPDEGIEGFSALKRERRVTHSVNEAAAESILAKYNLIGRCYETRRVLNQDEVMACLVEDLLSEEDVAEMFPAKVSWAFVPKK